MVLWVAAKSTALRAGGDDYCWAVGAGYGPIGSASFWWESFSGFIIHNLSLTYMVGMPLLHLPIPLGSTVTFMVAALVVCIVVVVPLAWTVLRWVHRRWALLVLVPIVMVSWWVYWWYPVTQEQDGTNLWLAVSMVHNQNINGGYVIETSVGVLLWFGAWRVTKNRGLVGAWLFAAAGAWAAFSGPALAVACTLMLIAALAWWFWLSSQPQRSLGIGMFVGGLATVGFSVVAYLAPGSQARSARMGTVVDLSPTRLGEWVNHVFPGAVDVWFEAFTTPGILLALSFSIFIGFFSRVMGYRVSIPRGGRLLLAGVTFSLMLAISSGVTNFFIYSAPYHAVPSRILAFASAWWFGVWAGAALAQRIAAAPVIGGVLLVGFVASSASSGVMVNMTVDMAERASVWEQGPAPVSGIVTDYLSWPDGTTCWQNLVQITPKFPDRGQPPPPYRFLLEERLPILT